MIEGVEKLKPPSKWSGASGDETSGQLERSIWVGRDWDDLALAVEAVEAAYQEGKISRAMAEDLACLAALTGQRLPEKDTAKTDRIIPAEELSAGRDDLCPCCGKVEWWNKSGQLLCATCHPPPQLKEEGRVAA